MTTRTLARAGGVEVYIERSVRDLLQRGHDVCVFPEDLQKRDAAGLDVPAWLPSTHDADLCCAIRTFEPDAVLSHGLADPGTEERLVTMRAAAFFAHAYHGTCVSGTKAQSRPHVRPCTRTLGPGCLVRYYPRRCGGWSPVTMLGAYTVQHRRLAVLRRHHRVFAISRHIVEEYARHGVERQALRLLPPPADPGHEGLPSAAPSTRFHFLYLGRLERLKGPGVFLEAMALVAQRLPAPLRVTVAGDGSDRPRVERQAGALARTCPNVSVDIVGQLGPEARDRLLADAGVLVVPSLWPEPFALVGLEAAAFGVPSVAFAVGGIPEWLEDGVNGCLVSAGTAPATSLADGILRAVGDAAHHDALRRGARSRYEAALDAAHGAALADALTVLAARECA